MNRTQKQSRFAIACLKAVAGFVVLILAFLIGYIFITGLPNVSWHFLTSPAKAFNAGGGIGIQLFNSFYLLLLAMLISLPIALGAAIYLNEYAQDNWFTSTIKTSIEILSSLPSVVVGLFGFLLFVVQFNYGFSIISGALTLTIFNLPLLTRNIEDSLSNVSDDQRQGGLGLGLSKYETIIHIVVPASLPGIISGIILCSGRVFGEAAALIYTAGQSAPALNFGDWNPFNIDSPLSPLRPAETLAVHIWKINSEGIMPDLTQVSSGSAAVLVLAILIFNLSARYIGRKVFERMTSVK
ncbi:phosphate ABC transporter permease PstA [Lentilactobacillus otakiensis]|jgi:phosphate transport system permease protein|uniref:Phosphate transport system permease protein PstA n=1 Tax=Lentilactobacillus otakiensis DSM 19908 = JCM 15040 TaxID=1423780 RepID=S4NNF2_9LACO|nr:phosphate ABC transporter permease PstA [Lentilactobacillus otakiensis]KRL09436.1 phosphate ABC transporter permease [Lentilactobacillus otakiensis DSM 19908 = JCM 15040]MBZ3775869.1 phosphate ABC transporter permease PstA [Lentilactobacillus otakiensis]MDV3518260.1 phosphate ABC transporter permease PstA [Lentilactobacillus otakiensis]GAD15553.1 phosphate ABC transporter permease [Lentilactobacillus otakiensis DSM 19908 = JCM 15040]